MSKLKPVYPPRYQQQLVEFVFAGRSVNQVAKESGLHDAAVVKWVSLDRYRLPGRRTVLRG